MDEKIKDQEVLLVKDSKDENLKAISGTDEKGGLKTVSSTAEHEQSFLKFDSTFSMSPRVSDDRPAMSFAMSFSVLRPTFTGFA